MYIFVDEKLYTLMKFSIRKGPLKATCQKETLPTKKRISLVTKNTIKRISIAPNEHNHTKYNITSYVYVDFHVY